MKRRIRIIFRLWQLYTRLCRMSIANEKSDEAPESVIYLSGCVTQTMLANPRPDLGVMLQPGMGNAIPFRFVKWAADNGCFAKGADFDSGDWLEWLAGLRRHRETCLFAVAPDVLGDAEATLERAEPFLPTIRQLGFRVALVAQDGLESIDSLPWDAFDVLFIGGTTEWKLSESAYAIGMTAKFHDKWVHMGRVNSLRRLRAATTSGFDSADGTFLKFGPDVNIGRLYSWLDEINGQPALELTA